MRIHEKLVRSSGGPLRIDRGAAHWDSIGRVGDFPASGDVPHHTYFKSAGSLLQGAMVRYAGMNAGKVKTVRVDPGGSTRIEIDFSKITF